MAFTGMTEYLLLKKLVAAFPETLAYEQLVRGLTESYTDLKDQREVSWWFQEMEDERYIECEKTPSDSYPEGEIVKVRLTERGKLYFRQVASKMVF